MLATGTINMVDSVLRATGVERLADKRQLIEVCRRAIGLAEDDARQEAPSRATDAVLSIQDAAARLNRTPRTIRWYCRTGAMRGVRTGATRRLTGVTASEIDGWIARQTQEDPRP